MSVQAIIIASSAIPLFVALYLYLTNFMNKHKQQTLKIVGLMVAAHLSVPASFYMLHVYLSEGEQLQQFRLDQFNLYNQQHELGQLRLNLEQQQKLVLLKGQEFAVEKEQLYKLAGELTDTENTLKIEKDNFEEERQELFRRMALFDEVKREHDEEAEKTMRQKKINDLEMSRIIKEKHNLEEQIRALEKQKEKFVEQIVEEAKRKETP